MKRVPWALSLFWGKAWDNPKKTNKKKKKPNFIFFSPLFLALGTLGLKKKGEGP